MSSTLRRNLDSISSTQNRGKLRLLRVQRRIFVANASKAIISRRRKLDTPPFVFPNIKLHKGFVQSIEIACQQLNSLGHLNRSNNCDDWHDNAGGVMPI